MSDTDWDSRAPSEVPVTGEPPPPPGGDWSWPQLPDWSWPELPSMPRLPAMPDPRRWLDDFWRDWIDDPPKMAPGTPPAPAPGNPQDGLAPGMVAGDIGSERRVMVAWTFDDGPSNTGSPAMKRALGGIPATWYIQRSRVEASPSGYQELKQTQEEGGEIAIHGVHPTDEHASWFPPGHPTIAAAIANLAAFTASLRGHGIVVHYVRLPYGLASELEVRLRKLGYTGKATQLSWKIAQATSRAQIAGDGEIALQVFDECREFREGVAAQGLEEWGGAASGLEGVSWQAESSGSGLADNVTDRHGDTTTAGTGKFEQCCRAATPESPQSLVVLAHEGGQGKDRQGHRVPDDHNAGPNAAEVGNDVGRMDQYAAKEGVRVEYYTMTQLSTLVRGTVVEPH